MLTTIDKLSLNDKRILDFLNNYWLKFSNKSDLDEEIVEKELERLSIKNENQLDVVLVNNKVIMVYEKITNIKSFSIERFCYDDLNIIGQFEGFIEPIYWINESLNIVYNELAKIYKNYLLFNLEDCMYAIFGEKSLKLYKPLNLILDEKMNVKMAYYNDYLQSIYSDITENILYNGFIKSFIKEFDDYKVNVYEIKDSLSKNNLNILFKNELSVLDKSNKLKTFGFELFRASQINNIYRLNGNTTYFVVHGIDGYEEKPLAVLNLSDFMLDKDMEEEKIINYIDIHLMYNEKGEYLKQLLLNKLNEYLGEKEHELILLNLENEKQFIEFNEIKKYLTNAFILTLDNKDEFLKRITLIE